MHLPPLKKTISILSLCLLGHVSYAQEQYSDSLICSSIYFIASGAYGENNQAAELMMSMQQAYEAIYSSRQNKTVTKGEISELKHKHLAHLGNLYDSNSSDIYELEMQCNNWKEIFAQKYISAAQTAKNLDEIKAILKTIPNMPKESFSSSHPRWNQSKLMMDEGFKVWSDYDRMTPFLFKENLRKKIQN